MTDTYACGIEMFRPEGDLYEILGVSAGSDPREIANIQHQGLESMTPEEHYAWRVLADDLWAPVYHKHRSTKMLFDAGFFDDGLNQLPKTFKTYDPRFACTPARKVEINYGQLKAPADTPLVLFTTGGMAPIHNGHIAMMESARGTLEREGYNVIGGYFCPGHDSYVGKKYNGTAAIPAEHRCAMVELAVQDSDWLELDPWAARFMPAELNFTDIGLRLEKYLRAITLIDDLRVVYVFGDDNKGFLNSPQVSVCVPRTEISSKAVREGNMSLVDPRVAKYLANWNKPDTNTLPYLIRNEENESIKHWQAQWFGGSTNELEKRRVQMQSAIRLGIAQLYTVAGASHKCHLLPVSEQYAKAKEVIGNRPTISLDCFYEGTYNFSSTRVFQCADAQFRPLYRAERAGEAPLDQQASRIPAGDYVLVEDDTVTGQTIASCMALLSHGVNITDKVILSDFAQYPDETYYDVVDLRDFIVGSKHGGLTVEFKGFVARAPYALPFVSLRSRAKIPASVEIELSRVIWQSNVRFFKDTGITLAYADHGFQKFALLLGWSLENTLEEVCQWYADALMENVSW